MNNIMENVEIASLGLVLLLSTVAVVILLEGHISRKRNMKQQPLLLYMTMVSMLSAISVILMLFRFPLPFIAPAFYKMDLSEIPVVIGAFLLGPIAGVIIELGKILLNMFINGTSTFFIGEIANITMGLAYIIPVSMIYFIKSTTNGRRVGLFVGTLSVAIVGYIMNSYILLPFYGIAFGGIDKIISAGSTLNSGVNNIYTFALLIAVPFNLFKFGSVSVLSLMIAPKLNTIFNRFK